MSHKTAVITHYDLDAVGCAIVASHIWNVFEVKCQGYGKVRVNLENLADGDFNRLVIADLSMEVGDLMFAIENFDEVIYFDHHIDSEIYTDFDFPNLEVIYSDKISATALMFRYGLKQDKPINFLGKFVVAVDVYDMWRTKADAWSLSYKLNNLFWAWDFWTFQARFKDGDIDLTPQEIELCAIIENQIDSIIEESPQKEVGSLTTGGVGVVIALSDSKALSSVSLKLDYAKHYIIHYHDGNIKLSVRARDESWVDVNDVLNRVHKKLPKLIQSAGGHRLAGGITLNKNIPIDKAVELLERFVENEFQQQFEDTIPF